MSGSILGEIRMFAGAYAPEGWAICDGTELAIEDYPDLHGLIGATFGGDGRKTFAVPNLCGRLPVGDGVSPTLGVGVCGKVGGSETVQLTPEQLPAHSHALRASKASAHTKSAGPKMALASVVDPNRLYGDAAKPDREIQVLSASAIGQAGRGVPHENRMPALALNYIIALRGSYPDIES